MSKGSADRAKEAYGKADRYSDLFKTQGQEAHDTLFPFLTKELNDPQGFGDKALNAMQTASGQAVSGATGAANERSGLLASRTGNSAGLSSSIGANNRDALKQQSDNVLQTLLSNEQLKEQQRQEGASGVNSIYDEGTDSALKSMGLGNDALDQWTKGKAAANASILAPFNTLAKLGTSAAGIKKAWSE